MKPFSGYDKIQGYADFEQLPKGGYIMKILDVKEEKSNNNANKYFKVAMDINAGPYEQYYMNLWKNSKKEDKKWACNFMLWIPTEDGSEKDMWTKRSFKTFTEALEESNDGYHWDWDEKKWVGLFIGGLFNQREYQKNNGQYAMATNLARICTVKAIEEGKYTLPDDRYADKPQNKPDYGFTNVPDNVDDDYLPFK